MSQSRVHRFATWLFVEAQAFWYTVGGSAAAIVVAIWLPGGSPEWRARCAGYLITVLGVFLVFKGIKETSQLFAVPTLLTRTVAWFTRLPAIFRPLRPISGRPSGTINIGGSASAVVRTAPKDSSLASRVDALEANLKHVEDRITQTAKALNPKLSEVVSSVESEKRARMEAVDSVAKRLETFSVSGLDWELVGLAYVLVGQALTTFPIEIGPWLANFRS